MRGPKLSILILVVVCALAFLILSNRSPVSLRSRAKVVPEETEDPRVADLPAEMKPAAGAAPRAPAQQTPDASASASDGGPAVIELTRGNFESFVQRCFQGEPCSFADDPQKMYESFKLAGDQRAVDLLLSLMRRNLKNETFREQYKDTLKAMIDDFYSPEELPFQEAAYYNYLGDLKKSLELYLALERKSEFDMTLRPAPKLNIANTFYDLGRFREALRYYEAALRETKGGETLRFIDDRIAEIRSKLRI